MNVFLRRLVTSNLRLAAIMIALAGCRTLPARSGVAAAPRSDGQIGRVVVLWSEAMLRQDNMPVAQGFAGKVYLFGAESELPVTAPGKFTIYAYDETGRSNDGSQPAHVKPDYSWEVRESDLKQLIKKDAVGWSYSLWVPCGPPASTERRYTVMMTFTPENGSPVLSESTLVTLPAVRGAAPNTTLAKYETTPPSVSEEAAPAKRSR